MTSDELLQLRGYPELKEYILDHTGLAYYGNRDDDLAARILRRLDVLQIREIGIYLQLLRRSSMEIDRLVAELTIGETYFFRHPEHFDLLKTSILPEIIERNKSTRSVRIWSAGCATGAEPYTIAIVLRTGFEEQLKDWKVSILATDINVDFLTRAQEALFGSWALRETSPELRDLCFRQEGRMWRLKQEFRRGVVFQYHNLMSGEHPAADSMPFDLILCRNVLIYFSQDAIRAIAWKMYRCLDNGGKLLLGYAELNQENFSMFQTLSTPYVTVYGKGNQSLSQTERIELPPQQPTVPPAAPAEFLQVDIPAFNWDLLPVPLPEPVPPSPAVRRSPEPLDVEVDHVRMLADCGNWEQARRAASQLVDTQPLNPLAHFTLGLILEQIGEPEAGREALKRAIYLDRGFILAHYHLGTSFQTAGEVDRARRSLHTALRLVNGRAPGELLPHGDGITASELAGLAQAHLDLITQ